jgi:ribosomal protein S18 acetylase RimI-like enzyme
MTARPKVKGKAKAPIKVDWLGEEHITEVCRLSKEGGKPNGWTETALAGFLRHTMSAGLRANVSGCQQILGYLLYTVDLANRVVYFHDGAVRTDWRREGVADALLEFVLTKPSLQNVRFRARVPERRVAVQLLLRKHGLQCVKIKHERFGDPLSESTYLFEKYHAKPRFNEDTPFDANANANSEPDQGAQAGQSERPDSQRGKYPGSQ